MGVMIEVTCPKCKRKKSVPEDLAGRKLMCSHCDHVVRVPWPEAHAPEAPLPKADIALPVSVTLGIASLVLGLLAVMVLCLPVIGRVSFVLSGIGLGLGLCGLAGSWRGRAKVGKQRSGELRLAGRTVDFPLAGTAACLLALALASLPLLWP
jgi:hypothetical protein